MSSVLRSGPSRQPSLSSTTGGSASGSSSTAGIPSSINTQSTLSTLSTNTPIQRFRKLVWDATIPISVTVESADLASFGVVDRSIETYYVRAPRISYLPLVLQEVRANLLSIMVDDAILANIKEEDFWLTYEGVPLRWHWPIGLLYDFHAVNMAPTTHKNSSSSSNSVNTITSTMRKLSTAPSVASSAGIPSVDGYFSPPLPDNSSFTAPNPQLPWRLVLRIGNAPLDKIHSAPGLDNCRSSFMSMVKEADHVRYGSTKRVVNLRRTEQDQLWDGVIQHDFDVFWSVASKLIPNAQQTANTQSTDTAGSSLSPSRAASFSSAAGESVTGAEKYTATSSQLTARPSLMQQYNESQTSLHSAAPSETNMSVAESAVTTGKASTSGGGSSSYRSLPMRFHLVNGAPVVQEPVAPYTEDGKPNTLHSILSALFPLLFPPTPTFSPSSTPAPPPPLAYAVVQGIRIPLDAEIPWIGALLGSADGWVAVCIHLLAEGEKL
ncbi:uncharacterized protein FA14DRAFT_161682 [Meira miltonrushii]|uniref:Autophagy protein 5 n=1 Tax=Meira miltonrushii TaxID=1280837 RepID=A0A316VFF6_9BASI|nr:uncharacterized protein FA14DRAFT_161682 [Meira miltonrushii]PWN34205.1 hypothetical protein FA14DRAFT_161682 [Meira miltonrushii]